MIQIGDENTKVVVKKDEIIVKQKMNASCMSFFLKVTLYGKELQHKI